MPEFDPDTYEYTAETTNATNTITAIATHEELDIVINVNAAPHTNGTAATWSEGENTVQITVADGDTYTVIVTKGT